MADISLSSRLPKGDANGLDSLARKLIQEPETVRAVIMLVNCAKIVTDVDTGESIPVVRIRRAEAVRDDDLQTAQQLIRRSWEDRAGDEVLPMELEDDLQSIFRGIDLRTASGLLTVDDRDEPDHHGPDFSAS